MVHLGKVYVYVVDLHASPPAAPVTPTFCLPAPLSRELLLSDPPAQRVGGGFAAQSLPLLGWSDPVSFQDEAPETVLPPSLLQSLLSAAPPSGWLTSWPKTPEAFRVGSIPAPSGPILDFEELPDLPVPLEADAEVSVDPEALEETVEVELVRPSSPLNMTPVFDGLLKAHERSGWRIAVRPKRGLAGLLSGILAILPPSVNERIARQHLPYMEAVSTTIHAGPPPYLDAEGMPCPVPTEPCDSHRSYPTSAPSLTSERMSFDHACTYLEQPCPDWKPLQLKPESFEPLSPALLLGWWLIEQAPTAQTVEECHAAQRRS